VRRKAGTCGWVEARREIIVEPNKHSNCVNMSKENMLVELDHVNFMFWINCMMYNMIMYDSSLSLLNFRVSKNFLKTVWRAFKAARRLMSFMCKILGFYGEPPGDMKLPAKRHKLGHPIFGFLHARPGGDEHPQGNMSKFCLIVVFWGTGLILIGKNGVIIVSWLWYANNCGIKLWLVANWRN